MFAENPKEFALTIKPPSGREGDHGSGGRSPRDFGLLQMKPSAKAFCC